MTLCFIFYRPRPLLLWHVPPLFGLLLCLFLYFFTYAIPEHHLGFGTLKIFLPDEWIISIFGFLPSVCFLQTFTHQIIFPFFQIYFYFLRDTSSAMFSVSPTGRSGKNCRPLSCGSAQSNHLPPTPARLILLYASLLSPVKEKQLSKNIIFSQTVFYRHKICNTNDSLHLITLVIP